MKIAVLDLGGTNMKAGLFDDNVLVETLEQPTPAKEGAERLMASVQHLLGHFSPFSAIGMSTAGQVEVETGRIRYANENLPGYTGTPVRLILEETFRCPVAVLNDAYAAAYGEGHYGAARGQRDYLCITYGTGVGGALVLDGQLYYGRGPSAGVMLGGLLTHPEAVSDDDPFAGTYERFASTTALVKAAKAYDASLTDGRKIFARVEEEAISSIVDQWVSEIARGLCSYIHLYNVPCVVLGGGIMEQERVFSAVKVAVEKQLIPGFRGVTLTKAQLGNQAGLYGALACLQDKLART